MVKGRSGGGFGTFIHFLALIFLWFYPLEMAKPPCMKMRLRLRFHEQIKQTLFESLRLIQNLSTYEHVTLFAHVTSGFTRRNFPRLNTSQDQRLKIRQSTFNTFLSYINSVDREISRLLSFAMFARAPRRTIVGSKIK